MEQQMCERVLVLNAVYHLWSSVFVGFLKLILGEWQAFFVSSQSFYGKEFTISFRCFDQ